MIPSIVPARDINGPQARNYVVRDTVYISPSGKDGYLGHTPDLPVKTLKYAKEILRKTKSIEVKDRFLLFKGGDYNIKELNPTFEQFTYNDNTIYDKNLILSPYNNEIVNVEGDHYKFSNIVETENGLWKIDITRYENGILNYDAFNRYKSFYLNDKRIYPARFPKKGAYDYRSYPYTRTGNTTIFHIKDNTEFLKNLIIVPGSFDNPCICVNADYQFNPDPYTRIVNLSSYGTNMISITSSSNHIHGLCIFGYNPNNPVYNLSSVAHHLCTEEGEFIISRENNIQYLYIKPYTEHTMNSTYLYVGMNNRDGLSFNSVNNFEIKDINFKYFNRGIIATDYSRNISISGCKITKCYDAIELTNCKNTNIYKNLVYDIDRNGLRIYSCESARVRNNIVKYVGMAATAHAHGVITGSMFWPGNVNMSAKSLLSSTPTTFTLALSDVPIPANVYGSPRRYSFSHDFNGYLEVTTGPFTGQKRIAGNYYSLGPNSVDSSSLLAVRGTVTYSIIDPWTPVGDMLSPAIGDKVKYVRSSNGSSSINTIIDRNHIAYSGSYCTQGSFGRYETISGNYIANASYGYSGDLGVVYRGSGDNVDIKNNIIENGRRGPGRYNGFVVYLDSQHNRINIENNVISQSDGVVKCHMANRVTLKNNIIQKSRGALLQFQHTGQFWSDLGLTSTDHQFHSFNNVLINSYSEDYLHYRNDRTNTQNPVIPVNAYTAGGVNVYHPALRVVHDNLNSNNDNYRSFYVTSVSRPNDINPWTDGAKFYRCGVRENRPLYLNADAGQGIYVKNGNWVVGSLSYTKLSSNVGVEGYSYPWQLPISSFYVCNNTLNNLGNLDMNFTFETVNKRQVPLFYTHDNCHYTDVLDFKTTKYPVLSDNFYAWHGRGGSDINGVTTGYKSLSDTNSVLATFKETQNYWKTTNTVVMSSGFDRLVDWEENSIFADPKLDPITYQLAPDSPVLAQGFKQIDTENIGLFKDDPEWTILAETLSANPIWGSADWGEYSYANHNDPWEPAIFNNVAALSANTATNYYKTASHLRAGNIIRLLGLNEPNDGGGGLFEYEIMSYAPNDSVNIIAPKSNFNGGRGRWVRQ